MRNFMSDFCCEVYEVFIRSFEELDEFKENFELEDRGMSAMYFGYRWYVAREKEDPETIVDIYLKTTDDSLEEATLKVINNFINLNRKELIKWLQETEEGAFWFEHYAEYEREELLKLIIRLQLRNLEYAELELDDYEGDIDVTETITKIAEAKDKEIQRLIKKLDIEEEELIKLVKGL